MRSLPLRVIDAVEVNMDLMYTRYLVSEGEKGIDHAISSL